MRKEIKDFLKSDKMVLILPRDKSRDIISQSNTVRSIFHAPLIFFASQIIKLSPHPWLTSWFYRELYGMKVGKRVGFAQIEPDYLLSEAIEIGDDSALGWKVKLLTHEFTQDHQRFSKIKIGKNVLIGAFTIVRGGVSIGDNATVAMGSLVTKSIPANEVWGGVPAKKIRDRKHLYTPK